MKIPCPSCGGAGKKYVEHDDGHAGGFPHYHGCVPCKGEGTIEGGHVKEEEKIAYLKSWGADNKCYLELEGEVGFGRPCVGLIKDNGYPLYGFTNVPGDYESGWVRTEEARPPEGVVDAYHKTECLAVLGHGVYALDQLYIWVKSLEANNVVVVTVERKPTHIVEALLNGLSEAHLVVRSTL